MYLELQLQESLRDEVLGFPTSAVHEGTWEGVGVGAAHPVQHNVANAVEVHTGQIMLGLDFEKPLNEFGVGDRAGLGSCQD